MSPSVSYLDLTIILSAIIGCLVTSGSMLRVWQLRNVDHDSTPHDRICLRGQLRRCFIRFAGCAAALGVGILSALNPHSPVTVSDFVEPIAIAVLTLTLALNAILDRLDDNLIDEIGEFAYKPKPKEGTS